VPNNLLINYIGSLTQKGIAKKKKPAKALLKPSGIRDNQPEAPNEQA
jgi:hypothetical protein